MPGENPIRWRAIHVDREKKQKKSHGDKVMSRDFTKASTAAIQREELATG